MLRCRPFRVNFSRSVYIPTNLVSQNSPNWRKKLRQTESTYEQREFAELDAQLQKIHSKQSELKIKLQNARDVELQAQLAKIEGVKHQCEAEPAEIATLDSQLILPPTKLNPKRQGLSENLANAYQKSVVDVLPLSIRQLLPVTKSSFPKIQLFETSIKWSQLLDDLPSLSSSIPPGDIDLFVSRIPLKVRAGQISVLEYLIPSQLRSQFVRDLFMSSYAELGEPSKVEELISQSPRPTIHSFGHLAKALFRTRAQPESVLQVLKRMKTYELKPTIPLMNTAIQSMIQHDRHEEAQALFDNMKYWSVSTQPDLKMFNSMILSAAKQRNINRCLDLFEELQNRRPYPLTPDEETYNYMVYACSRDPSTHLKAWDFFMEATNNGLRPNRQSFRALLYLCGNSGEVSLARALIRNLSAKSIHLLNDFDLNCLMTAYRCWKPTGSAILGSTRGPQIRSNLMMEDSGFACDIPFLPVSILNSDLILSESSAIIEYFASNAPQKLCVSNSASRATTPILFNYLRGAVDLGKDINEFRRRYNRFTKFESGRRISIEDNAASKVETSVEPSVEARPLIDLSSQNTQYMLERDQHIYRLALQAAIKFKNLEFGRQVWTERGNWRSGPIFQKLPSNKRNRYDFQFARDLIELLAVCGRIDESLLLAKSAQNLGKWTRNHLAPLIAQCERMEYHKALGEIAKLVRKT